jgi:hypothetical protein
LSVTNIEERPEIATVLPSGIATGDNSANHRENSSLFTLIPATVFGDDGVVVDGSCAQHAWTYLGSATASHRHPRCERPRLFACEGCGARRLGRCKTSNLRSCRPCGRSYRHRVRMVAEAGRKRFPGDSLVMITLTAPGEREHRLPGGRPCPCTPAGGVDLARWNGLAASRFNRFVTTVRRRWGIPVQYFKGAELQDRGAVHFHVLVRLPKSCGVNVSKPQLRKWAVDNGFGHEIDIAHVHNEIAANYVAKYVSKTAGERASMPFVNPRTGEVNVGRFGGYRTWTSSRQWGATMRQVELRQLVWARAGGATPPAAPAALDLSSESYATESYAGNEPTGPPIG